MEKPALAYWRSIHARTTRRGPEPLREGLCVAGLGAASLLASLLGESIAPIIAFLLLAAYLFGGFLLGHLYRDALDDLELLRTGVLHPVDAVSPGQIVELRLPAHVAADALAAGAVEIVDPEGVPLARVAAHGQLRADDTLDLDARPEFIGRPSPRGERLGRGGHGDRRRGSPTAPGRPR